MRKLSPFKAVSHALRSVFTYRRIAVQIGLFWIPLLFAFGAVELILGVPDPETLQLGPSHFMQLLSAVLGLVGFCSIAVSWHRFILRDEPGSPMRIDANVWRYIGNSLLIMLMSFAPVILLSVILQILAPGAWLLLIPVLIVAGAVATRLSIKLPAVALGRTDFTFRDAWKASEGSFGQMLGVFLLNAAIVFGAVLLLILIVGVIGQVSPALSKVAALVLASIVQLFYTVFNASVFTSLYGFFVERRDF